jgi:DnaK suppressor protein
MAKSNKKGKVEKAKKGESRSKTKPKTAVKSKTAAKVKKAVVKAKPAPAKKAPKTKVVVKKGSTTKSKGSATKSSSVAIKKTPASKVTSDKVNGIKSGNVKTGSITNLKNKKIVSSAKVVKKNTGSFELGVVLRTGRRPQAIINKKKIETDDMGEEKLRYSEEELKDFEVLILEKLDKAKKELIYMKEMLSKKNDEGTDNTAGTMKLLEDGADTLEKENFSQLAVRQQKFVTQLENALARIKNGTYGICIDTGKLIPKERLKAVPHTQHSIEAKLNRRD